MGTVIKLTCSKCKLESDKLYIGKGSDDRQCYGVAWCPQCAEFTTPLVPDGLFKETVNDDNSLETTYLLDDRSIACPPDYISSWFQPLCLSCCQGVSLFDMENKPCPICGAKMTEKAIGIWKLPIPTKEGTPSNKDD